MGLLHVACGVVQSPVVVYVHAPWARRDPRGTKGPSRVLNTGVTYMRVQDGELGSKNSRDL